MSELKKRSEIMKKYYDDCICNIADSGCITVSSTGDCATLEPTTAYTIDPKYLECCDPYAWKELRGSVSRIIEPKKGGENMRYLYEVILVNPKNDTFYIDRVVKRSETSALMAIYAESNFIQPPDTVPFDDLKTSCRVLMEWKKEKSLKKAIETIKEAVE